jgi:tricorn protease
VKGGTVKLVTSVAVGALLIVTAAGAAEEAHLMRWADVHGDRIVFTYEDDLWVVSSAGGDARRMTSHPGAERYAKFSPDGSLIAFTGSYDGGTDVYVMDARGGVPRRLTYHPAADRVLGWHPDGTRVLFRSRRGFTPRAEAPYLVSVEGGRNAATITATRRPNGSASTRIGRVIYGVGPVQSPAPASSSWIRDSRGRRSAQRPPIKQPALTASSVTVISADQRKRLTP